MVPHVSKFTVRHWEVGHTDKLISDNNIALGNIRPEEAKCDCILWKAISQVQVGTPQTFSQVVWQRSMHKVRKSINCLKMSTDGNYIPIVDLADLGIKGKLENFQGEERELYKLTGSERN